VFRAVSKGIQAYEGRWKAFVHCEWPQILATASDCDGPSAARKGSTEDVKGKRRVKPTLVTHIGLPSTSRAFSSCSSAHQGNNTSPFLTRSIRLDNSAESLHLSENYQQRPTVISISTVRIIGENERRIGGLALFLVKSKSGHQGFLDVCTMFLGLLKTLHQIYAEDKTATPGSYFLAQQSEAMPTPIEDIENLFTDLHLPIYLAIELLKSSFSRIYKLTHSFIAYLECNNCARKLCLKIFQKAAEKSRNSVNGRSSLPRTISLSTDSNRLNSEAVEKDVFDAIAYADKRDSRNFAEQPVLHANQQKVRDLFLDYIRSSSSKSDFNAKESLSYQSRDLQGKVREVMKGLAGENYGWFGELLVCQWEQMRRRMTDGPGARMERLEERLTSSKSSQDPSKFDTLQTSGIVQFLRMADSHRLHHRLTSLLNQRIAQIEQAVIDGRKRSGFMEECRKACHLARLLAIMNSFEDEHVVDEMIKGISECFVDGYALLRVPWIIAYIQACQSSKLSEVIWKQLNSLAAHLELNLDLSRRDFILILLIRSSSSISDLNLNWTLPEMKRELSGLCLHEPVDLDASLDVEQLLVPDCQPYCVLLASLKSFKKNEVTAREI